MLPIPRLYQSWLQTGLNKHRQMLFVSGPRQAGKTLLCRELGGCYLNWDVEADRALLLGPQPAVAEAAGFKAGRLKGPWPLLVLDEMDKRSRWKAWLKGFFDAYEAQGRIVVTGSARLDLYQKGGDSLMGRYLLYRLHPLSAGELLDPDPRRELLRPPAPIASKVWRPLWEHGGFPEPYSKADAAFTRQWRGLRRQQLLREDIRDLTRITETAQLEKLLLILEERSGQAITLSDLSRDLGVSVVTVGRWLEVLASFHVGFLLRPWQKSVANSLRKEPKWFLRDWSGVQDPGARAETAVACHLLKAVEGWTDQGLGDFALAYLRDKGQREVDFVVLKDRKPWFLVEVKRSETKLSPALAHFQRQIKAPHAFQVVWDLPYEPVDPFTRHDPVVVPAQTLLGMLL
jgi:predicted AAA+ superfamily ATPase